VLIVNLFGGMRHVTQIKAQHPAARVIALPDVCFNDVFRLEHPAGLLFLEQLQAADVIGYVSDSNRQFYGALVDKPLVYVPHAIGTDAYFETVRAFPKSDYLITLDHSEHTGQRPLDYTVPNIAAVAAIQRETGIPVVYVNAGADTRAYAARIGLKADFLKYVPYADYVALAARARLGVDMFALHGFGRNEITLAYAGTPCIGSTYTHGGLPELKLDPWQPLAAVPLARRVLAAYEDWRAAGIRHVEERYCFDAARAQLADMIKQVTI